MPPRRPKDKGTDAERAVVRYLQAYGWPNAERRALRGREDAGDVTGTPGICWEVKSRKKPVSDLDVTAWLVETETERVAANAEVGVLVVRRHGVGEGHAGRWWAYMRLDSLLPGNDTVLTGRPLLSAAPVRMLLGDVVRLLHAAGYGEPPEATRGDA